MCTAAPRERDLKIQAEPATDDVRRRPAVIDAFADEL
jgi:hypothetical protein